MHIFIHWKCAKTYAKIVVQAIDPFSPHLYLGGKCHFVKNPSQIYEVSRELAESVNGHYMDQVSIAIITAN